MHQIAAFAHDFDAAWRGRYRPASYLFSVLPEVLRTWYSRVADLAASIPTLWWNPWSDADQRSAVFTVQHIHAGSDPLPAAVFQVTTAQ